jgi:hypothetical protein
MFDLTLIVVLGTSIWVYFDAKSLGFGKRQLVPGHLDAGPGMWCLGCLALWIIMFPLYLAKRGKYKRAQEEPTVVSSPSPSLSDAITQIERLAQLWDRDIVSEEEFAAKKRELLGACSSHRNLPTGTSPLPPPPVEETR